VAESVTFGGARSSPEESSFVVDSAAADADADADVEVEGVTRPLFALPREAICVWGEEYVSSNFNFVL